MTIPVMRVRNWARFGWLRHGFSTRAGGVSTVYGVGELNLGNTREDEAERVAENRERFCKAVGKPGWSSGGLAVLRQVHGTQVLTVSEGGAAGNADGLLTGTAGLMLGVQAADCVPVLVADTRLRVVGAFHAGWRGTAAGIVEVGVGRMRAEFGSRVEDLVGAVGPSIGRCCYAVGDEVRERFGEGFAYAEELFAKTEYGLMLDLWEANRRQLVAAGVRSVEIIGECTGCALDAHGRRKYFSYRMEKGATGRGMGLIGVAG